ncbi:hypothetical protein FRC07_010384, partial [Ceratobasidium sp. 392]
SRVRLRIKSLDLEFKTPPRHPVNLKLLSNGRSIYNTRAINNDQVLRWEDLNPIDAEEDGMIEIRVYELHWHGKKRERVGFVSLEVHEMARTTTSLVGHSSSDSSSFSLTIALESANGNYGASRRANAAANEAVATLSKARESMGQTRNHVKAILKVAHRLSEKAIQLNPTIIAVADVCEEAWLKLNEKDRCDELVARLVTEMGALLPDITTIENDANTTELQDTVKELLLLVEDASRFVTEYKSDGAAVRVVRAFISSSAQDQVDRFIDRFGRLKETLTRRMLTQVAKRVEDMLNDADRAILEKLLVPEASYDPSRACLDGTRMGILEDLRAWTLASTSSTTLFWLYGPAGCGKSSIATSVSEMVRKANVLGGSLFCKRDNEHLRKPKNVISHLAASLAFKCPAYGKRLVEALRADPSLAHTALKNRFVGLVVAPLESVGKEVGLATVITVVDAIDESGTAEQRTELVRCLLELSGLVDWLKVVVTSRPNDEIRATLERRREFLERRDLFAEDEASVTRDTKAHTRSGISSIPGNATDRTLHMGSYCMQPNPTELDPSVTLDQILDGQRSTDEKKALGGIYTTALNEGLGETNNDTGIIQLCVGAIVLTGSRRPLPDTALAALLSKRIKQDTLERVINRLGSVLYRDDQSAVRVLHQSFSDYLTGVDCPEKYLIDLVMLNAELAASCLELMLQGLR